MSQHTFVKCSSESPVASLHLLSDRHLLSQYYPSRPAHQLHLAERSTDQHSQFESLEGSGWFTVWTTHGEIASYIYPVSELVQLVQVELQLVVYQSDSIIMKFIDCEDHNRRKVTHVVEWNMMQSCDRGNAKLVSFRRLSCSYCRLRLVRAALFPWEIPAKDLIRTSVRSQWTFWRRTTSRFGCSKQFWLSMVSQLGQWLLPQTLVFGDDKF